MTRDVRVPDWALSFEPESYATFRAALVKELQARGVDFDEVEGVGQRGEAIIFFGSLVARASQVEPPWDELIADHIDVALAAGAPRPVSGLDDDTRSALRLAAYPRSVLERGEPDFPFRDFTSDLIEVICLDRGGSIESVTHAQLSKWNVSWSELRKAAAANLRDDIYTRMTVEVDETSYVTITGTDQFASGRAPILPRDTRSGVVFAVPDRDHLLYHRVRRTTTFESIQSMARHGAGIFAEANSPRSALMHFAFGGEVHSWSPSAQKTNSSQSAEKEMPQVLIEAILAAKSVDDFESEPYDRSNPYSPTSHVSPDRSSRPFAGALVGAWRATSGRRIMIFGPLTVTWLTIFTLSITVGSQLSSRFEAALFCVGFFLVLRGVSLMTAKMFTALYVGRETNWILAFPKLRTWFRTLPHAILALAVAVAFAIVARDFVPYQGTFAEFPLSMVLAMTTVFFVFGLIGAAANPFWVEDESGYFEGIVEAAGLIASDPLRAILSVIAVAMLFISGVWFVFTWIFADVLLKGVFVHAWSRSRAPDDYVVHDEFALF